MNGWRGASFAENGRGCGGRADELGRRRARLAGPPESAAPAPAAPAPGSGAKTAATTASRSTSDEAEACPTHLSPPRGW